MHITCKLKPLPQTFLYNTPLIAIGIMWIKQCQYNLSAQSFGDLVYLRNYTDNHNIIKETIFQYSQIITWIYFWERWKERSPDMFVNMFRLDKRSTIALFNGEDGLWRLEQNKKEIWKFHKQG